MFYNLKILHAKQDTQVFVSWVGMIVKKIFFDQTVKTDLITYDNIWKITIDPRDYNTTGCRLYYPPSKEIYKLIRKYVSKQQALDTVSKEVEQISFNVKLPGHARTLFILKNRNRLF